MNPDIIKETVVITGGSGLVGNGIKHWINNNSLASDGLYIDYNKYNFIFMSSKDCNLLDYNQTYEYFSILRPSYVIHLAANVGGLYKNMKHKVEMFLDNITINNNVLKVCHEIKVKKLVSCLSTCIFPDNIQYPINENMLHNGIPHNSNDAYAYSKRMLDVLSSAYRQQYNDNFICVIPTNIYGSYDNFNLEDSHVIPGLIHKCYLAKHKDTDFIINGTGSPLRQFIYSKDLGRLLLWTLFSYDKQDNIILSPPQEYSIKYIGELIAKLFDLPDEKVKFDTTKNDGQFKKTADSSRLFNYFPMFNFTSIDIGLSETVEWFLQNNYTARK